MKESVKGMMRLAAESTRCVGAGRRRKKLGRRAKEAVSENEMGFCVERKQRSGGRMRTYEASPED